MPTAASTLVSTAARTLAHSYRARLWPRVLLQALLLITTEGSPQVKAPARWSSAFKHFLQCSLHVQVERRATAEQLLMVRCACARVCRVRGSEVGVGN